MKTMFRQRGGDSLEGHGHRSAWTAHKVEDGTALCGASAGEWWDPDKSGEPRGSIKTCRTCFGGMQWDEKFQGEYEPKEAERLLDRMHDSW